MKKNTIIALILISIIGCKEIPPYINFDETVIGLKDTTYIIGQIPESPQTNIFIEDLTGVRCLNCPKASDKIKEIMALHPNKVVAVAAYPTVLKNLMDPWPGFEKLNTPEADDIFVSIYGSPSAIPTGGVNRKLFPGETSNYMSYNKWTGYADIIAKQLSPVKLDGEVIKIDSIKVRVAVKIIFTQSFTQPVNLTLYITESKIKSKQSMPDGSILDTYIHNHVLRKAITPYNGIRLKTTPTSGDYIVGRTFEKEFEFEINPNWVKENCSIVALVNRSDINSKEVLQALELDIK